VYLRYDDERSIRIRSCNSAYHVVRREPGLAVGASRQVPETAPAGSVAAALAALSARQAGRAEAICREQLEADPRSMDHLRLLGRALAMQSRLDEAEQALRDALVLRPDFPPLHEDLGGILAMQRRLEEAAATLTAALRLDPGLPLARKRLAEVLAALGRGAEADSALEAWFEQDPARAQVAVALEHLRAGRKDDAISTLRRALREDPDNVDSLHTLAQAYWGDEKRISDIEALLRRATELAPALVPAWMLLGMLLHESDRPEDAIECYRRAIDAEPDNAAAWSGLGADYAQVGDMEKSAAAYARSLALQPRLPGIHMSYAHVLKALGHQEESLREYRAAIALKPDFGEVYWSMANLKVFRFEPEEVAAMLEQVGRDDLSPGTDVHFRFALGKAFEDAGDYDRAWEFYRTGNERQRPLVSFDPVGFEARHAKIADVFSREFLEQHAGEGCDSDAPIFIVGLPRSGSTLIEQILASHSQVEGTLELPTLGEIAASVGRYRRDREEYPDAVRELTGRDFRAYGQDYLEQTRIYRATTRPRFTDKLPNNFSHIGFAHLILPNAKIINARRHPLDSILGSFKQLFGKGQHFTYDMEELVLYYRQYHEIMRHWHRVLPGKVLDVHYEETVGNFEEQVRRILDHCGLPFEEACLDFHRTERAVRTASSEQVRQPLYTRALGTWRRYAKHLAPWQDDLADIIAELPERVRNAGL
jgi:tetratricopeptide (TPR) repeat protein